ncbi:unnamed protein product, partial [Musa acuminata var. zebrina]
LIPPPNPTGHCDAGKPQYYHVPDRSSSRACFLHRLSWFCDQPTSNERRG